MSSYLLRKTTDVEALGASEYPAIAASKQGPDLPLSPYLFKTLTAAAAPYYKTTGTRNKLEQRFNKALRELNKVDGEKFQVYILLHGAQAQGVVLQVSSCRAPPQQGLRGGRLGRGGGE